MQRVKNVVICCMVRKDVKRAKWNGRIRSGSRCEREKEGEKGGKRQRDRETDRQTDREEHTADRQTDIERGRGRQGQG